MLAPLLTPLYCLFRKGLILDGWPGWYYTLQRTYAELLLTLVRVDARRRTDSDPTREGTAEGPRRRAPMHRDERAPVVPRSCTSTH